MLLIRVDASNTIGAGHLMRCITIADYFRSQKIELIFLSRSESSKDLIANKGFELIKIPVNASIEDELKLIEQLISEMGISAILLDINNFYTFKNLQLYNDYLLQLKKLSIFLISFEDPFNCVHAADIIIIPYLGSDKQALKKKENTKYLLGLEYYILRSEFVNVKPTQINKELKNVLITMGGSDPQNITGKVLKSLKNSDLKLNLTIVIGDFFKQTEADINDILQDYKGTYTIAKSVKNIAQMMSDSDLAIINSGLTKYEIIAVGLPGIVISNNEYHAELMNDFNNYNVIVHLGEVDKLENYQITKAVEYLAGNYEKRQNMSATGKSLIDGKGIERILAEIPIEVLQNLE
jgi:UDP-2,4-diacetamido-2,4,6-trideoxy-beta-L-altropyranose hydrolase